MKQGFIPDALVRFKLSRGCYGTRAKITHEVPEKHRNRFCTWKYPGYAGEGFYFIITIPDQRQLIAHEDDIVLETQVPECSVCRRRHGLEKIHPCE